VKAKTDDISSNDSEGTEVTHFNVRLPMPNQLNATYSQNWEDGDTSSLGAEVVKVLNSIGGDVSNGGSTAGAVIKGGDDLVQAGLGKRDVIIKKLKQAGAQVLFGDAARNYLDSQTQSIINTKREMLYKGTDFRSFSFEFDLAPTSRSEVVETMALIKGLKYWSAPENLGETIHFPSTFTVNFFDRFGNAAENLGLKIGKSAITKLDVNFTPDGLWQTFTNGHPIHLKLTIELKEIELMYRNTIQNGELF
jgi:hypothetical protein